MRNSLMFLFIILCISLLEPNLGQADSRTPEGQGILRFSFDGLLRGYDHCVNIAEPSESFWSDNYLCFNDDLQIRWSYQGQIPDMRCTQITDSESPSSIWKDNYLCVSKDSNLYFYWLHQRPSSIRNCVQFLEPSHSDRWSTNYLCYEDRSKLTPSLATRMEMKWSHQGPISGMKCTQLIEPSEPSYHSWDDNYICTDRDYGLKWSYNGSIPEMECVQLNEPSDSDKWHDNYLCYPKESGMHLAWSHDGLKSSSRNCIAIYEPKDPDTWDDNYLCF